MSQLMLDFHAGHRDVVLQHSQFTDPRLPEHVYPRHCATCHRRGPNGFEWRRGIQTLAAFLVRSKLCWLRPHEVDPAARTFQLRGRRVSLASSLNDLITKGSNSTRRMFGVVQQVPLFADLFARTNPDFKTDPQSDVVIALNHNLLSPADLEIRVGGVVTTHPAQLESLALSIERQWLGTRPVAARSSAAHAAPSLSTPPTPRQIAWRDRLDRILTLQDFPRIDRLWGEQVASLLAAGDPAGEAELLTADLPEPWRTLCHSHILVRHGRWTEVLRRLRTTVYTHMQRGDLSAADMVWSGRAANLLVLAAMRVSDEHTVRECLRWVEQLCHRLPDSEPLRAQWLHYRARFRWRCRYQDLERAGRDLELAQQLYESLPTDSPWRELGLSQVADSQADYLADIGDLPRAVAALRDSIHRKKRLGDLYGQSLSHGKLGRLYLEACELHAATEELNLDLEIARQLQDRRSESVALLNLAEVRLLEAEADPDHAAVPLSRSLPHLESALNISRTSGNDVGTGLALVGQARRLLLPRHPDRADLHRAVELAEAGHGLLALCTRRPEWKRYAQTWLGWAHAKLAETPRELAETDQRFFVAAIEDLRAAGLRMDLAEALYQRSRMLITEGGRLGIDDHAKEKTIECLGEAWEHASLMQVKTLTQRYLGLARHIDPDLWMRTVIRYKQETARLAASNRRLRTEVADRSHALSIVACELIDPVRALNAYRCSFQAEPGHSALPSAPAMAIEHLEGVEQTARLLAQPLDLERVLDLGLPADQRVTCPMRPLLERVVRRLQHASDKRPVKLEVFADTSLEWTTIPPVLESIVYHLANGAVAIAVQDAGPTVDSSVRATAQLIDGSLQIDVECPGLAFSTHTDNWERLSPSAGVGDGAPEADHNLREIGVARQLARRLGGDVVPVWVSESTRHLAALRVFLPPLAPASPPDSRRE